MGEIIYQELLFIIEQMTKKNRGKVYGKKKCYNSMINEKK